MKISTYWAGVAIDFIITVFLPYIFTAFKAARLLRWAKVSRFFKKLYDNAIKRLSKLVFNAMDRILYNIMGKAANAATRSFTLARIQKWIGNILNFSIGYGIAWILDCIDKDGKNGYITF